jgi:hypothetical protein
VSVGDVVQLVVQHVRVVEFGHYDTNDMNLPAGNSISVSKLQFALQGHGNTSAHRATENFLLLISVHQLGRKLHIMGVFRKSKQQ